MLYTTGTCSSAQIEAISQLQPETSVSCHLSFTSDTVDFSANDVFKTRIGFDSSIGKTGLSSGQRLYSLPVQQRVFDDVVLGVLHCRP